MDNELGQITTNSKNIITEFPDCCRTCRTRRTRDIERVVFYLCTLYHGTFCTKTVQDDDVK